MLGPIRMKNLEEKWKKRRVKGYQFLKYLTETKKDLMKSSMIASVRKRCGLGDPPKQYDQNANEAMNSVIKKAKRKGIIFFFFFSYLLERRNIKTYCNCCGN